MTDSDRFIICANLWEKKLITLDPFPEFRISFYSPALGFLEDEVKRSRDTINPAAYIFNAMQAESQKVKSLNVLINALLQK